MERQAAQAGSSQDPNPKGGATEEMIRSLMQVGRTVRPPRMRTGVMIENESEVLVCLSLLQRGTSLLRRKEEQLQQLESSIAEEVRRTSGWKKKQ